MTTRREVLTAFLGLPAALAACRLRPSIPPGEIAFRSEELGHLVRDRAHALPPPERTERVGVVIVGAGVAGLSAAWRLKRAGFEDFLVVEIDPVPGGTARSGRNAVSAYPWGAHYITTPMKENRAMVALLGEMGALEGVDESGEPVVAEQFLCRDPHERVFYEGAWREGLYLHEGATPEDLAELRRFQAEMERFAAMRDGRGRRAFTIPSSRASDDAEFTALDRVSMREWMRSRGYRSPRLLWLVDYACRDDYGCRAEHTSAWAGLFYFASRIEREGSEAQAVITWPEGNGRLVAHLHGHARDRVRTGTAVFDVNPSERGVTVSAFTRDRKAVRYEAERVIFAAPHFLARYVIRPYRESPPEHALAFEYGSWMVANLTLRRRPKNVGFAPAWDNVLYESPSLGYVVSTHQALVDRGRTVWTYYHPLCDADAKAARRRLLSVGRDEWADIALADLERAHPEVRKLVERCDVMRWGHAMVRPKPGFVWSPARLAAQRPDRGVHFAHSDLSGMALFEEAFDHGIRAAEEVLSARGIAFESVR